eukprot:14949104-Heterocapsa_arctica.AAC.1
MAILELSQAEAGAPIGPASRRRHGAMGLELRRGPARCPEQRRGDAMEPRRRTAREGGPLL